MNFPSINRMVKELSITRDEAKQIRAVMEGEGMVDGESRMTRIDRVLGTHGVEYISRGKNAKSPGFYYCNAGDTYAATILKVKGVFRIGCWGDLVERGNYD